MRRHASGCASLSVWIWFPMCWRVRLIPAHCLLPPCVVHLSATISTGRFSRLVNYVPLAVCFCLPLLPLLDRRVFIFSNILVNIHASSAIDKSCTCELFINSFKYSAHGREFGLSVCVCEILAAGKLTPGV